jgi:glyoxylase-like metal-dependent hydrolase (beta-lactamase superfamily II)
MSSDGMFGYDVFVSEPIPMNVPEPLPNGERRMYSPMASTLIYGAKDAVLIDPPLTTDQAKALGDWVEASRKRLTHVFATHGHGDHWFTAGVLAERFGAQVVASAGTITQMQRSAATRSLLWDRLLPAQIPPSPVTAVTVPGARLTLEGHDLVIVEVGHADSDDCTVLHVPDLALVVAGDAIYNGVHQYLGDSMDGGRDAWRAAIDAVAALRPRRVVAGHKNKDLDDDAARVIAQTRRYLDDADDLLVRSRTATDFFDAMIERHPDRRMGATILWIGAKGLYAHSGDPVKDRVGSFF